MQTIIGSLWPVGQLFTIPGIQDSRLEDSRFGAWDKTRQDPRPVTSLVLLCILYQAVLVMSMVSPFLYICVRDQDSRQDLRHVPAVLLHLSGSGYVSQVIQFPTLLIQGQDFKIPKYISVVCVIYQVIPRCWRLPHFSTFLQFLQFYNFHNFIILQFLQCLRLFTIHCTSYNIHNIASL